MSYYNSRIVHGARRAEHVLTPELNGAGLTDVAGGSAYLVQFLAYFGSTRANPTTERNSPVWVQPQYLFHWEW